MAAIVAVILSFLLASPVTLATLSLPQIAALAGMAAQNLPAAIKTEKQLIVFLNSPAFRAWVAANGELAIRLRPGESTER